MSITSDLAYAEKRLAALINSRADSEERQVRADRAERVGPTMRDAPIWLPRIRKITPRMASARRCPMRMSGRQVTRNGFCEVCNAACRLTASLPIPRSSTCPRRR